MVMIRKCGESWRVEIVKKGICKFVIFFIKIEVIKWVLFIES